MLLAIGVSGIATSGLGLSLGNLKAQPRQLKLKSNETINTFVNVVMMRTDLIYYLCNHTVTLISNDQLVWHRRPFYVYRPKLFFMWCRVNDARLVGIYSDKLINELWILV